jgi:hypothetical protein
MGPIPIGMQLGPPILIESAKLREQIQAKIGSLTCDIEVMKRELNRLLAVATAQRVESDGAMLN